MSWPQVHKRSAWIVVLTLLIPLVLYLNTLVGFLGLRQEYQAGIDQLQPRVARLRGLIESQDVLRESLGEVDRQVINLVYPASDDRATVSANLQKEMRQLLVDAGLSVTNSQVLQVRERGMFDHIGIKLTVAGDLASLDKALVSLGEYLPLVLVESLDVWPRKKSRRSKNTDDQSLTATLQLLSLRAVQ